MNYLPRVLKYVRPYGPLALIVVVLIVASGLADLAGPWPLKLLVDNVLGTEPLPPTLGRFFDLSHGRMGLLAAVVGFELAVVLLQNAFNVAAQYAETLLHQRMVLDFRSDLFQHAQRLSMAFHSRKRAGMLIYIINSQGDAAASLVMTVPALVHSFLTLVGMFWIVLHVHAGLALLSLLVLPFLFLSVRYYITRIQERLLNVRTLEGESLSIIHEAISMLRVIVAFGRESHEFRRFRDQGLRAVDARVSITIRQTLFSLVVNMTTAVGAAAVLGLGAYLVLQGRLTVGLLLVVMYYIAAIYKPLESITYTIGSLQEQFVNLRVSFGLMDTEPEIREPAQPKPLERARGRLAFDSVDFAYEGRRDTLRGISFAAEPGQTVAIVGPTGTGKTTLISLLPRFYDPTGGRILLDGIDLRDLSLQALRRQISLVLQEPLLFSGTIAENIRYGRLEATDDEIIAAATAANAHDFIMRLPQQYQTEIGERGSQLSGGERQRICVARAFLKDAPILILDEPTSSIDSKTEAVILDALERLMIGRTSFMIAHRLSTIRRSDSILVMDQGRIVQHGTHEDLVQREGLYRQFHEIQTRQARRALRGPPGSKTPNYFA